MLNLLCTFHYNISMKYLPVMVLLRFVCPDIQAQTTEKENDKELDELFASFSEEGLKLYPINATIRGDNRYNDLYPALFADSYQAKLKTFYTQLFNRVIQF